MRKYLVYISILFVFYSRSGIAQDFPLFSQYVFNGLMLNPAYAGSRDVLSVSMMYRKQWAGFDAAPEYQSFTTHAPMRNKRLGLGLLVLNEQVATTKNIHTYVNYAYRLFLSNGVLALGLKAGVNMTSFNYNNIQTNEPDPTFQNAKEGYLLPNFGTGLYYNTKKYFLGFSIPYLLSYSEKSTNSGYAVESDTRKYSYFITTGYLLQMNQNIKLKPSTLIKYNRIYKTQVDLNLNVILLNDRLWLGTCYRISEAMVGLVEYQINSEFRVGYSMDYTIGKLNKANVTSHEFCLRYDFNYKIKAFNPRYF